MYRDAHGVPHITAENEAAAWYALGYEQARDGLLWIQYACKAARGELTWAAGVGNNAVNLKSDMAVKIFNSHLGGLTSAQLHALFAPVDGAIDANFWDNCVAFALGADAYRQAVAGAPATPPSAEYALRVWLDANHFLPFGGGQSSLAWVYQHRIEAVDIASQGAWTTAVMSLVTYPVGPGYVNSSGTSFGNDGASDPGSAEALPELVNDPLAPGTAHALLDAIKLQLQALPGAPSAMLGSNSFCWNQLYCNDGSTGYAGLLADPHHPVPFVSPYFPSAFWTAPNHMWFAHVRVTPPGASQPSFDTFGHMPHAAATFFSSHNQSIAVGGTQGSPNFVDAFVLRVLEDPATGLPDTTSGMKFYSYYHDTDHSNGGTPANTIDPTDFRPITNHTATIKRADNQMVSVPYWRADSFGVILPRLLGPRSAVVYVNNPVVSNEPLLNDVLVWGDRVENSSQPPPRHRAIVRGNPPRMQYWSAPQPGPPWKTSPMVVTLRAPMDSAVAGNPLIGGENMHWLLLRDFWEITHGTGLTTEVRDRTNGGGYLANICIVGRQGGTFSTQLSAIPKRGDDALLDAAEYTSFDKWKCYALGGDPVPVRHSDDRMFDWQFGDFGDPARPGQLAYLTYSSAVPAPKTFKPFSMRLPGGAMFPLQAWPQPPEQFWVQNGGFVSVCNDVVWGFSRKREQMALIEPPPQPLPFNDVLVTNNPLLAITLDAGTLYQSDVMGFEAPGNQQIVVDQLTRQAERIVRGVPYGSPPLTPQQMREFVVSPRLYNEPAYTRPDGITQPIVGLPSLPNPIRQLKEFISTSPEYVNHSNSPLKDAKEEVRFFSDLWAALYGQHADPNVNSGWQNFPVPGAPGLQISLRQLWVEGNVASHPNQVFWYDDVNNAATLHWIDLPPNFPLIDFMWSESELSRGFTTGNAYAANAMDPAILSATEATELGNLVGQLVTWEANGPPTDGYRNLPASTGACLLQMMRMGYNGVGPYARKWVRLRRGEVEYTGGFTPLTSAGQLPNGTGNPVLQGKAWGALQGLAFPDAQQASFFKDDFALQHLRPPYGALYSDRVLHTVRPTLRPQDINDLVEFFLVLGNHYIKPEYNAGNPSRKLARYELFANAPDPDAAFMAALPGMYPLTSGLARVTAARALLDAGSFLGSPIPPFSQVFRARAYAHTHNPQPGQPPLWPDASRQPAFPGPDAACVGSGLRAVSWWETADALFDPPYVVGRGYQNKFLGLGGSYATTLTIFPPQGDPESYFWCTPGVEAMGSDLARFDFHMTAFATNVLMRSHFSDFAVNPISVTEHYYVH